MTVDIRILNRTAGGDGSPGGTGNQGNLALNFDPAAKKANGGLPKLFASDGTAWTLMNPPATAPTVGTATLLGGTAGSPAGIGAAWAALGTKPPDPIVIASYAGTTYVKTGTGGADTDWTSLGASAGNPQVIDLTGSAGADIGAAYTTWAGTPGNALSGSPVIASYGAPASTYVLTNNAAPGTAASWKQISSLTQFATEDEVHGLTVTNKAIDPKGLGSILIATAVTKTVGPGKDFTTLDAALKWAQRCVFMAGGQLTLTLDDITHTVTCNSGNDANYGYSIAQFTNAHITIQSASGAVGTCRIEVAASETKEMFQMFLFSNCNWEMIGLSISAANYTKPATVPTLAGISSRYSHIGFVDMGIEDVDRGIISSGSNFGGTNLPFASFKNVSDTGYELTAGTYARWNTQFGKQKITGGTLPRLIVHQSDSRLYCDTTLDKATALALTGGATVNVLLSGNLTGTTEASRPTVPFYRVDYDKSGGICGIVFNAVLSGRFEPITAPSGTPANDAKALVSLNAAGKIDPGFLSVSGGLKLIGNWDLTAAYAAPATAPVTGNYWLSSKSGALGTGYAGVAAGTPTKQGDLFLFDGTNYHLLASEQDLTAYVAKAGANAIANDMVMTWAAPANLTTVIDGTDKAKSQIENFTLDNCVIDGGTY